MCWSIATFQTRHVKQIIQHAPIAVEPQSIEMKVVQQTSENNNAEDCKHCETLGLSRDTTAFSEAHEALGT